MADKPSRRHEPQLRVEKPRDRLLARPARRYPVSDHCDGQQFFNASAPARDLGQVFTWLRNRQPARWPGWVENEKFTLPPERHSTQIRDWRVTFINHATMLLQIGPYNLLTDPVWSERVSPFSYVGPRRVRAAGVALQDLPPIDVVLLSHNHYDHLDEAAVKVLAREHPQATFVVPLGVKQWFTARGISPVVELDWWQAATVGEARVTVLPAQHFSGRGPHDRNATLWCSLLLEVAGKKIQDVTLATAGARPAGT